MSSPEVLERPTDGITAGRYMTVIFNNDHTPMDLVIATVMAATKCDFDEAYIETWEAHNYGQAPVHFGSKTVCDEVSTVIESIGVQTEVRKEWDD